MCKIDKSGAGGGVPKSYTRTDPTDLSELNLHFIKCKFMDIDHKFIHEVLTLRYFNLKQNYLD